MSRAVRFENLTLRRLTFLHSYFVIVIYFRMLYYNHYNDSTANICICQERFTIIITCIRSMGGVEHGRF